MWLQRLYVNLVRGCFYWFKWLYFLSFCTLGIMPGLRKTNRNGDLTNLELVFSPGITWVDLDLQIELLMEFIDAFQVYSIAFHISFLLLGSLCILWSSFPLVQSIRPRLWPQHFLHRHVNDSSFCICCHCLASAGNQNKIL